MTAPLLLGIETSCDETAAAVVADGRVVLSNVVDSQADLHAPYGGVFPEVASRQHMRTLLPVVAAALAEARVGWSQLAGIAVTHGPGLAGSLLVGVNVAKGLAMSQGLPLVGVNHLTGHLYSNWLHRDGQVRVPEDGRDPRLDDPPFPHLALIVSGGHTDLVLVRGHGELTVLGRTLDDAAGEAFDKVARMLALGYPGGPRIEKLAAGGMPRAFEFPVADTANPLDFSFSGLKTAVRRVTDRSLTGGQSPQVADLAASFQDAVVRALVSRVLRAHEEHPVEMVLVAGGVAANGALAAALREALPVPVRIPPLALCTDNAAMIAAAGHWSLAAGPGDGLELDVVPSLGLGRDTATAGA